MDAIKVYTRRIINELKIANEQFADVEIIQSNGEGRDKYFSKKPKLFRTGLRKFQKYSEL